jgi:hypothetical protein
MRTIRKTRPGESHIHNHGTVAGGETIAVDDDTAAYLVDNGGYEYAESDAQSESDTDEGEDTSDTDADAEPDGTDLSELTYQELRDLASEHDISGRSDMDKADLIDALGEVV